MGTHSAVDRAVDDRGYLMTAPCVNDEHFETDEDGGLRPVGYLQWRHVATNSMGGFTESYTVDGGSQAEDLGELQVAWTNADPIDMLVYGVLTRAGTTVTTTARTRLYLETYVGAASGSAPADPTANTLIGRIGNGIDLQLAAVPINNSIANFGLIQTRQAERSSLIGSTVTLTTGQEYKLRVRLRVDAGFWETLPPDGSAAETQLSVLTGETRLDLYAIPVIV